MPDIDWNAQIIKTVSKLNSKIFPPIDPLQQQLLNDAKPIYVYTTYLDSYDGRMGSFGQFQLKGVDTHGSTNRDDWEQYHLAQTIPSRLLSWDMSRAGTQVITNAKGDDVECGSGEMAYTIYDGLEFVADLLNRNDGYSDNNLENWGVFATYNNPPRADELAKAKKKLEVHLNRVVGEGDRLNRGTAKEKDYIGPKHRNASSYLKMTRDWSNPVEFNESCKFCGVTVKSSVAMCPNCKHILNQALYNSLMGGIPSGKSMRIEGSDEDQAWIEEHKKA
jgi:hypothetical protein